MLKLETMAESLAASSCDQCRRQKKKCSRQLAGCERCASLGFPCEYTVAPRRTRQPEAWVDGSGALRATLPTDSAAVVRPYAAPEARPRRTAKKKAQKAKTKSSEADDDEYYYAAASSSNDLSQKSIQGPATTKTNIYAPQSSGSGLLTPVTGSLEVAQQQARTSAMDLAAIAPISSEWSSTGQLNPMGVACLSPGAIFPLISSFLTSGASWGIMRPFFYDAHSSLPRQRRSLARVYRHPFFVLVALWAGAANMTRGLTGSPLYRSDVSSAGSLQSVAIRLREAVESQMAIEVHRIRSFATGYFNTVERMDEETGMDLLASVAAMQVTLRTLLLNFSFHSYIQVLYLTIEALFKCGVLERVGKGKIRSTRELAARQEWLWLIRMLATQDLTVSNWTRPAGTPYREPSFTVDLLQSLPMPLEEGIFDPIQDLDMLEEIDTKSAPSEEPAGDLSPMLANSHNSNDNFALTGGNITPASSPRSNATLLDIDAESLMKGSDIVKLLLTPDFGGRRLGRSLGSIDYSGAIFAMNVVVGMSKKLMIGCLATSTTYLELAFVNATGKIPQHWPASDLPALLKLVEGYKQVLRASNSLRAVLSGPELDQIDEVSDIAKFRQLETERFSFRRLPSGSVLILHIILHVQQMISKGGTFRGFATCFADWTSAFTLFPQATLEMVKIIGDILHHAIVAGRYVASLMDVVLRDGPPSEAVVNNGHDISCVLLSALAWFRKTENTVGEGSEYSRRSLLQLVRRCLQPVGAVASVEARRLNLLERLLVEESFGLGV